MKASLKNLIILVAILFYATFTNANYPIVRNFQRNIYNAGSQNWCIDQDSIGRIFFGNAYGLLNFNNSSWNINSIGNNSAVRSILLSENKIYVGGSEEFGFFDLSGAPADHNKFHSLASQPVNRHLNVKDIWKIHALGEFTWFQSDYDIFRFKNDRFIDVIHAGDKITASKLIGNHLFVALRNGQLKQVENDRLADIPIAPINAKIVAILPYQQNKILIATDFDGIYLLDGGTLSKITTPVDDFIKENQLFCAEIKNGYLALGTVNCGVAIINMLDKSEPVQFANTFTGLTNNTILSLHFDNMNNLWCGLDNGIAYVVCNSPFSYLLGSPGAYGAGYTSLLFDNYLYFGTNQGLYSTSYPFTVGPRPQPIKRIGSGQVWAIRNINGSIFFCKDDGLYSLNAGNLYIVPEIPGAWSIEQIPDSPDFAVVSTYDGFFLIHKSANKWSSMGKISGYSDIGGKFSIVGKYIWIAHWMKGIYRLHLDIEKLRFDEAKFFNHTKGLPTDNNNSVGMIGSDIVFSTEGGFYQFDNLNNKMKPYEKYNNILGHLNCAHIIAQNSNSIWCLSPAEIVVAKNNVSGTWLRDSITFRPLRDKIIPGFDHLNFISSETMIAATQDGFYNIRLRQKYNSIEPAVFVAAIYANQDSLIFIKESNGNQPKVELDYSLNSLRFEATLPEYRSENATKYSYFLENYDHEWSSPSNTTAKEYTHLSEGDYIFRVKAVNAITGTISTDQFQFSILPPWYRSFWAKCVYLLLAILIIFIGTKTIKTILNRASQRVMHRKEIEMEEMKRTAEKEALKKDLEIADLKSRQLELDIKHKGIELSNITMNVVRKNEILLAISSRISKIIENQQTKTKSEIDSQLNKLIDLIDENISHDDDWRNFTDNFDAVYEDFTKHLLELHPDLTHGELRVCCYIKMGLSSKDIAPLLHISYRSVEMTRYRLRKKLNLERSQNLTDYLLSF